TSSTGSRRCPELPKENRSAHSTKLGKKAYEIPSLTVGVLLEVSASSVFRTTNRTETVRTGCGYPAEADSRPAFGLAAGNGNPIPNRPPGHEHPTRSHLPRDYLPIKHSRRIYKTLYTGSPGQR